jgi:hypothetical protein
LVMERETNRSLASTRTTSAAGASRPAPLPSLADAPALPVNAPPTAAAAVASAVQSAAKKYAAAHRAQFRELIAQARASHERGKVDKAKKMTAPLVDPPARPETPPVRPEAPPAVPRATTPALILSDDDSAPSSQRELRSSPRKRKSLSQPDVWCGSCQWVGGFSFDGTAICS